MTNVLIALTPVTKKSIMHIVRVLFQKHPPFYVTPFETHFPFSISLPFFFLLKENNKSFAEIKLDFSVCGQNYRQERSRWLSLEEIIPGY